MDWRGTSVCQYGMQRCVCDILHCLMWNNYSFSINVCIYLFQIVPWIYHCWRLGSPETWCKLGLLNLNYYRSHFLFMLRFYFFWSNNFSSSNVTFVTNTNLLILLYFLISAEITYTLLLFVYFHRYFILKSGSWLVKLFCHCFFIALWVHK